MMAVIYWWDRSAIQKSGERDYLPCHAVTYYTILRDVAGFEEYSY
jgi:hypothetical protein